MLRGIQHDKGPAIADPADLLIAIYQAALAPTGWCGVVMQVMAVMVVRVLRAPSTAIYPSASTYTSLQYSSYRALAVLQCAALYWAGPYAYCCAVDTGNTCLLPCW